LVSWEGVFVAMVTPMKKGGKELDLEAMRSYCDFILDKGVQGIFVGGTTGEGPLLSMDERKKLAEVVVDQVKGKTLIIIQTGCITTLETIELTLHAKKIGADAAGVLLPYFYNLDEEAIFEHFVRIADAVPELPLFLYNIPQCTCNNLSCGLFERLLNKIETIVGVKTSNPDIFQIQEFVHISQERCSVFLGHDGLLLAGLSAGAKGIVSGNASCFPEPFVEIYQAFKRGDLEKTRKSQLFIDKLRNALGNGSQIASFKRALDFRGVKVGSVRSPNRELSQEEVLKLRDSLSKLGLV